MILIKKFITSVILIALLATSTRGQFVSYYNHLAPGLSYKALTKIGDSNETAIVGVTNVIHTYSNPVP